MRGRGFVALESLGEDGRTEGTLAVRLMDGVVLLASAELFWLCRDEVGEGAEDGAESEEGERDSVREDVRRNVPQQEQISSPFRGAAHFLHCSRER